MLSFFVSIELDELELDGELGDVVAPDEDAEPDGEVLGEVELEEPDAEPEGDVVEEPVAPAGPRSLLRLQPVTSAAPSAREIARASVETFMEPPWLNLLRYSEQGSGRECYAAITAPILCAHLTLVVLGVVSGLRGPPPSPFIWKSRCWSAWFGSTCCDTWFEPLRLSCAFPAPLFADEVTGADAPVPAGEDDDEVSVFGDGGVGALRLQPASASATANARKTVRFIQTSVMVNEP